MTEDNSERSGTYAGEFLRLRCAGDVLNAACLKKNVEKEISESMAVWKRLRGIALNAPMENRLLDMCAGNALTSILAAHTLPFKGCVALDIKMRNWNYENVKRFTYAELDIFEEFGMVDTEHDVICAVHACGKLAERVVEIYNESNAHALVLMPCCHAPYKTPHKQFLIEQMGSHAAWAYHLAGLIEDSTVHITQDKKVLSPCNYIIEAIREPRGRGE
jgi:hypothetical protein